MLQLVHVAQHLRRKIPSACFFRINCDFRLEVVGVPSCHYASCSLFFDCLCPGLGLRVVVELIHAAVVDIVSVLYGQPRVLPDVLTVLSGLEIDYVEPGCLLIVHAALVQNQTSLSVVGQLRPCWHSLFLLHLLRSRGLFWMQARQLRSVCRNFILSTSLRCLLLRPIIVDGSGWCFGVIASLWLIVVAIEVLSFCVWLWEVAASEEAH